MELLDGAFIFLGFIGFMLVAVTHGLYTSKGSGINRRSYSDAHGDAPGARRTHEERLAFVRVRGTR